MRLMFSRIALVLLAFAAIDWGCLSFFRAIEQSDESFVETADAIVVFSGDPARIIRGFNLLIAHKAPRLFTAGVDNIAEIEALKKANPALAACCIEGEQSSRTTHEDAQAIAQWLKTHAVGSAIVVTTNIHMPRALAELKGQTDDVRFALSGVSRGLYDSSRWATDPRLLPILKTEWIKYIAVRFSGHR